MDTEATRTLIEQFYDVLPTGDRDKLAGLLADDVVWTPPETAPIETIRGRDAVAAELGGDTPKRIFDMKTFRLDVKKMLADGDTAVVLQSISAKTREGEQYDNDYCWVYTCRDGKIAVIDEYADTLKASRIMKW